MTLGEIKKEALKIMFVSNYADISNLTTTELLYEENYKSYLVNMNGSINRCFSDIEEKRVLPSRVLRLDRELGICDNGKIIFNLKNICNDYFDIERVVLDDVDYYDSCCDYYFEGEDLILADNNTGNYKLVYKPKLERLNSNSSDDLILDIPDNIACNIPYFIKGDLYREDEPNEASEARNWYESAMSQIEIKKQKNTTKVETIYSQGW